MMTKTNALMAVMVFGIGLFTALSPNASAEDAKFELKANATMKEILAERVGKRTTLRMFSGEDMDGTVTAVGNGLVHISKLAGKDFYDAVVEIDKVSAVIFQVRQR